MFQVTQKVFEVCGTPRLGWFAAFTQTLLFVFEEEPQKSEFERMLKEVKKKLNGLEGFGLCSPSRHVRSWNCEGCCTFDLWI